MHLVYDIMDREITKDLEGTIQPIFWLLEMVAHFVPYFQNDGVLDLCKSTLSISVIIILKAFMITMIFFFSFLI